MPKISDIQLYYSTTASAVPTAANLLPGELAINISDGKLFYEDAAGVVQEFVGSGGNVTLDGTQTLTNKTINLSSNTVTGTFAELNTAVSDASIGYLNIPQNLQNAAYTLLLTDAGKHIYTNNTTAYTWTIPANASVAFPVGTAVTFVNGGSAGDITIAITTDTLRLASDGTTGSKTLAPYGVATAIKTTTTEWVISGTGVS